MKIGTFTAVLVSFPHFLSVFTIHVPSMQLLYRVLKKMIGFRFSQGFFLITMAAFGNFCPNGIRDKSQF